MSIIVPALNEAQALRTGREQFMALRQPGIETLLVDGGSDDDTRQLAAPLFDQVLRSARGRALQMNAGARAARGEWLAFLHADTRLAESGIELLRDTIDKHPGAQWGRFDVRLDGDHYLLRIVERAMNWRSAVTGIATGDQCLFVHAAGFAAVGGYSEMPLMEDIDLSRRLRAGSWPLRLRQPVSTDARRWQRHGVLRTIALMWCLRLGFWLGVAPARLARRYPAR